VWKEASAILRSKFYKVAIDNALYLKSSLMKVDEIFASRLEIPSFLPANDIRAFPATVYSTRGGNHVISFNELILQ